MTYEQIDTLLSKGFTPDQIVMLTTPGQTILPGSEVSDAQPSGSNSPEGTDTSIIEEPAQDAAAETPAAAPVQNDNSAVIDAIADLKKTIQAQNIKTASMETVNPDANLESIMAEFIRPRYDEPAK